MGSPTATTDRHATLAKPLAPEDVRPGDYLAVLDQEFQYPAIFWFCEPPIGRESEVIRVRTRPSDAGEPLRVVDACLPFVFVQPPKGEGRTIDLRAVRVAGLDRDYARRVCRTRKQKKKQRRRQ